MATFTPDVVFKMPEGKSQEYPEIKRVMRQFIQGIGPGSRLSFVIEIVDRKSDRLIVAVVKEKLTLVAPNAKGTGVRNDAEGHEVTARWRDTWVKTKSGWQNKIGVTLPDK